MDRLWKSNVRRNNNELVAAACSGGYRASTATILDPD